MVEVSRNVEGTFKADENVLEFELVHLPVDLKAVEERAKELKSSGRDVEVREEGEELVITYRSGDKVMEYRFSEGGVKGRVEYQEEISDPKRAFESQVRLIKEFWLKEKKGMRERIIEAARRLYEEKGEPPSAREIARALGYKSPRVLYGPDRFSSLKEIYEAAGIPAEPRIFPGREEAGEEVTEEVKAEPIRGYRLEARIVGNYLYKVVEVEVLGQKLETEMKFPLKEPIEVCRTGYKVRVIPTEKGPVVEIWKRKRR